MIRVFFLLLSLALISCAKQGHAASMLASYYGGRGEYLNRHSANGERFNRFGLTAAHRSLPFGTRLLLTNPRNGRSVIVRITDRGPAAWTGRLIDVSFGAAQWLGMIEDGVARLNVSRVSGR